MATRKIVYLEYEEAVLIHFSLMRKLGEIRYGIDHRDLIESALARPRNAAIYTNADIIGQAATLLSATTLIRRFLELNGYQKNWTIAEQIELVLNVESDKWNVAEIENWLRPRVR